MAISFFSPAIARSRELVISRSTQAVLQLVPELKKEEGEEIATRAFFFILSGIIGIGLLSLLLINTLLTQDAFVLQRLKQNVNITNDHRDALLRQVALQAAPDHLADVAKKAGMIPTNSPIFIDISVPIK
jgi:hypothetical protein